MKQKLKPFSFDLLMVCLLSGTYWVTRLFNLTAFPIFTDEAIYIRWSQIGSYDAAWRFIPLTDGKPPLYHWFMMLTLRVFSDPLIAGRLVSVGAGFANLIGIWLATFVLTRKKTIAYVAALLYLTSPFMVVYDRLAIVDSLLTTFSLYSFALAVLLFQKKSLDIALLLGAAIGGGMLTKASGLIFLIMSPATIILDNFKNKIKFRPLLKWLGLLLLAAFVAEGFYSILRLSQFFYRIEQKNYEFIIPVAKFLQEPFTLTRGNAKSLFSWQLGYLTLPVATLIALAFFNRRWWRQNLLLLAYYLAPFLMISSFNKIIFPRFLLFSTPFLLILAAIGHNRLVSIKKLSPYRILILAIALIVPAVISLTLITKPLQADIPQSDRDQYLDSWPAGWGINQIVAYLKDQSTKEPIYIGTQGTFGLMPYAIEIYLQGRPNIEIDSFWPVDVVPGKVLAKTTEKTTYFIYNELENIPPQSNLELVMEFKKERLGEIRHLRLFKVHSTIK